MIARSLLEEETSGRPDQGRPDLTRVSASAKAFASDVAMQVTTDAVQLFGGAATPRTSRSSG